MKSQSIAIVHDRLIGFRGGEAVVQQICDAYPGASLFSLIAAPEAFPRERTSLLKRLRATSVLQWLPSKQRLFRHAFVLYPIAAWTLPLRRYDVVISSTSAFAHWIRVPNGVLHVSYVHTPLRQAWSEVEPTARRLPAYARATYRSMAAVFRWFDRKHAQRIDAIATNSSYIRRRIRDCYDRDAVVIPPGVEISRFSVSAGPHDFFLCVSALVPYKRIDIAVEACSRLNLPLKVIGSGPELEKLRTIAGPTVQFLGQLSDVQVASTYSQCKALIVPTIDDFGIVTLEAQAAGRPVIAARGGGALDTVLPGITGEFFAPQTSDALVRVLQNFDDRAFKTDEIRRNAKKFDVSRFRSDFVRFVQSAIDARSSSHRHGFLSGSTQSRQSE